MSECLVVKDGHSNGVPAMSQQFTESDRAVLAELLRLQVPKKEIAARLHKHRSSVYRELSRNSGPLGYIPIEAQQRAETRRWLPRRVAKLRDPEVQEYVGQRLRRIRSPAARGANSAATTGGSCHGRPSTTG